MENNHATLDRIKCPNCGELFPVSEAIYHQIADKTREELRAESVRQQKAFAARDKELKEKEGAFEATLQERLGAAKKEIEIEAGNKARAALALEIEDFKRQAAEKDAKLEVLQKSELEVRKQKRELDEKEKNRKLNELLDELQFNQAIIFVKSTLRATELDKLLKDCNFPSVAVHSGVSQDER